VRAGVPPDLLPGSATDLLPGPATDDEGSAIPPADDPGAALFAAAALVKLAGHDPESELRAAALRFAADVRAAEDAAVAAGLDPSELTPADWRRHFPATRP
jgi:XTP/dITP diphosphohydrolase